MKIVIRRTMALGDVILATPVVRRFRRENPTAEISVVTRYPEVFEDNPWNVHVSRDMMEGDVVVDLDLAYERRPHLHIVEAYMREAFGDAGDPGERQQVLTFPPTRVLPDAAGAYVAVHAGETGWKSRTIARETWNQLCGLIVRSGMTPVLVGRERDDLRDADAIKALSPSVRRQAQIISGCALFVGADSGVLHVAGATSTPILGVFTCVRPELRLPWREGVLGYRCDSVVPAIPCVGCLTRRPPPVTTEACERGDMLCVEMISPGLIFDRISRMLESFGGTAQTA